MGDIALLIGQYIYFLLLREVCVYDTVPWMSIGRYWVLGLGHLDQVKRNPWMEFEFQDLSETIGTVL